MGAQNALPSLAPERRELVLAELERVLSSAAFRGSKRSQEFLRYVVSNALENRADLLKERSIGAEIFGRAVDYDTGDDSIVRVKASEVRKRLAQYYAEAGDAGGIQIELPAGSYTPEFRFNAPAAAAPAPAAPRRRRWILLAALPAAVAMIAATAWLLRPGRAIDRFWGPVFKSPKPVLVCVAHPVVYTVSGRTRELIELPPEQRPENVPAAGIVSSPGQYVAFGDALALADLAGFFGRRKKPALVRIGTDATFADLRNSPTVLIGAYTNQWTVLTNDLRFVFDRDAGGALIRDRMIPSQFWRREATNPPSDYVILTRLFDSRTGEVLVVAAGLSHIGTQAAGEFLTNPEHLAQAVRNAPADWHTRNMQLVLWAEVIGKTTGPPKVMASWYWDRLPVLED